MGGGAGLIISIRSSIRKWEKAAGEAYSTVQPKKLACYCIHAVGKLCYVFFPQMGINVMKIY